MIPRCDTLAANSHIRMISGRGDRLNYPISTLMPVRIGEDLQPMVEDMSGRHGQ